jgi:hypothetical protein
MVPVCRDFAFPAPEETREVAAVGRTQVVGVPRFGMQSSSGVRVSAALRACAEPGRVGPNNSAPGIAGRPRESER